MTNSHEIQQHECYEEEKTGLDRMKRRLEEALVVRREYEQALLRMKARVEYLQTTLAIVRDTETKHGQ